jgi:hypothetical protein
VTGDDLQDKNMNEILIGELNYKYSGILEGGN